jgi:hypothetical protein
VLLHFREPEESFDSSVFFDRRQEDHRFHRESELKVALTVLTVEYLIWVIVSLLVFEVGTTILPGPALLRVITPGSLMMFLAVASLATGGHLVYVEPALRIFPRKRVGMLLFCVGTGAGLFGWVRLTGSSHPLVFMISTANLLVFANLLGPWIISPVKRPSELLPLCLIMSLADLFSVTSGPTKQIAGSLESFYRSGMKGPAPIGDFIIIKIAVPGVNHLVPVFGVADWIIIAFLCAASARFGIHDNLAGKSVTAMRRERRMTLYLPIAVIGLLTAVFFAHLTGLFLPALPLIAAVYLLYGLAVHPPLRKTTPSDWKLMVISILAMGGLLAASRYLA